MFERLKSQEDKKQEEFEEAHKLSPCACPASCVPVCGALVCGEGALLALLAAAGGRFRGCAQAALRAFVVSVCVCAFAVADRIAD